MTGMDDLVSWLRAQLDDDERVARGVLSFESEGFEWDYLWLRQGRHNGRVTRTTHEPGAPSPRRVLAEIGAKRRIIDWCERTARIADEIEAWSIDASDVVEALALPFADRDGYREEWRP